MSMPADAINAILNDGPAPLHLWVMNETSGTTFADQVSSGAVTLTAGAGCVPNGWGPMAGKRNYGGPQTPAPSFSGATTAGASASGAILGGLPLGWGIIMMMNSTVTNFATQTLYCERGTSGNDEILFKLNSGGLALTVCDDTSGHSVTAASPGSNTAVRGGSGLYHDGGQLIGCSVDPSTGKVTFFQNGLYGLGTSSQSLNASHTWTNSGITANIGLDPLNTGNAFSGSLCWVALFGSAFTAAEFNAWYEALTPPPAHGSSWTRSASGAVYPNSAFWNEPLADDAPLDPNSSAIVSQLMTYWSTNSLYPSFAPAVPMFDLQRTGRGIQGVRSAFLPTADQHSFLATVPTPDTLISAAPYPSSIGSDALTWVVDTAHGLQWDAYTLITTQDAGGSTPSSLYPPYINSVTPSYGSGTLAAGTYVYAIAPVNSNGEGFSLGGYAQGISVTLTSTGKATLNVSVETGGTPPPTSWKIYRSVSGTYHLLTTVSSFTEGTNTFVDDGSYTPSAGTPITLAAGSTGQPWGNSGSALTEDWAAKGGGGSWDYLKNAAFNPVLKPSGAPNNGESAASCPAGAGVVTLEEALNGYIPHPIGVAMPSLNNWEAIQGRYWPANRHDGTNTNSPAAYPTMEGMRLRLDPSFDPNSLTYSSWGPAATFQRAFATALRDYGLINHDSTPGGMLIYAEEVGQTGRDGWAYILGGLFSGSVTPANNILGMIPWSSMEVLAAARNPSRTDGKGRRTNRLDVAGYPTPVPY